MKRPITALQCLPPLVLLLFALGAPAQAAEDVGNPATPSAGTDFFMSFHIDGFKGESYSLKIEGAEVRYRSGPYSIELNRPWRRVQVPKQKLDWFKRHVEEIGVSRWKEQYFCPVLDGVAWQLELRSDGRKVICNGGNAFPPRFDEFQLDIAWLVQSRFGIAVEEKDCADSPRKPE